MLNGASSIRTVTIGRLTMFRASLYDMNEAIEAKDLKERRLKEVIPKQYHQFPPCFSKILVDRLPLHRPGIDHEVRVNEGATLTWGL